MNHRSSGYEPDGMSWLPYPAGKGFIPNSVPPVHKCFGAYLLSNDGEYIYLSDLMILTDSFNNDYQEIQTDDKGHTR